MKWSWHIWIILSSAGAAGTFLICSFQSKHTPVKVDSSNKIWLKIFLFWVFMLAYIFTLLNIAHPVNGLQLNALIMTFVMFAYIVFGLWINTNYMIWLGLAVTICTIIGFYIVPHNYYSLWMSFTVGPLVTGTGILIRYIWK